jgi:hypothetical protein
VAEFAQFVAISKTDDAVTLQDGGPPSAQYTFDLADLDDDRTVIIMFKVSGDNGARLVMSNSAPPNLGDEVVDFTLDSTFTKPRSWHEIAQGKVFGGSGNKFEVHRGFVPGPKVAFSDIVILYHAKTD